MITMVSQYCMAIKTINLTNINEDCLYLLFMTIVNVLNWTMFMYNAAITNDVKFEYPIM